MTRWPPIDVDSTPCEETKPLDLELLSEEQRQFLEFAIPELERQTDGEYQMETVQ